MAVSDGSWKDWFFDLGWRVASGPGSTAIYLAAAMSAAALGIPAYVLVAVAVVLVLSIDPPQKIRNSGNSVAGATQ